MRKKIITPWQSDLEFKKWIQNADNTHEYKRRLAIWMTKLNYSYAEISQVLLVSVPTVRRWVLYYNRLGPRGLEVGDWGGRRRELLTPQQEAEMLHQWPENLPFTAKALKIRLGEILKRKVSLKYAYDLIHRHRTNVQSDQFDGEKS